MKNTKYIIILCCVLCSGCDLVNKEAEKKNVVEKPTLAKIDNLQLAKVILKPQKVEIKAARDPFQPLLREEKKSPVLRKQLGNQELKRFKFLGVAKINNQYVAYLKSGSVKGTFRKDDKLKDYTVVDIGPEQVKLSNGEQTITLKRGASK